MSTRLWDANALEKVDDHTFRMNLKVPQVAIPEHLFHYPLPMIDPEEGGNFGPGSNGTGPFDLVEQIVGERAVLRARKDYWGDGPYLDELHYIDLGDDASAVVGASGLEAGAWPVPRRCRPARRPERACRILQAVRCVDRGHRRRPGPGRPTGVLADPRLRKAMRLAVDTPWVLELGHRGLGAPGEHHHVCPIHPDYKELPFMARDVEAAKQLLAEAGHPDGFDTEIACLKDPAWELQTVQALVEQWKEANIRVNINVMPSAQFWDVWDKVPFGFTAWAHRPLGFMVLALGYRGGVPWNESHFDDEEFDTLLTKAEGTLDIEERREILGQMQMIMQERGPMTQPLWRSTFTFYDQSVVGFRLHPTSYIFGEELGIQA